MRANLSTILVAIDGSEMSIKAAEYGIDLARKNNSKIIILHVIRIHPSTLMYTTDSAFKQFVEKNKANAEEWFGLLRKKASVQGVKIRAETIEEMYSVPKAIINFAEKESADVIMVGGIGQTGFKGLLLGSVASDVVRYSKFPVFVIK